MKLGCKKRTLLLWTGLFILWVGMIWFDGWSTKPTSAAKSFEGFLQTMRPSRKIEKVMAENQTYLLVSGKMPPFWFVTIPSGGPCYVYDEKGVLVDWTRDAGDDPKFVGRWMGSAAREGITVDQARKLVRTHPSQTI